MSTSRVPVGARVVAVLFALLALNALNELLSMVSGDSDGPVALAALQGACGVAATAAAVAAWIGARWAPALAALYGVIAAAMVVSLGPLLDMPAEEAGGLWIGAAVILVFSLACAWYLRRALRRAPAPAPTESA